MRVFITGAANGIGRATTEKLVENGHKVIAYDNDAEGLENLPAEVQTYQGNVTDKHRLEEAVRKEIFEVLVNCAGIQKQGAVEDIPVKDFQEHMDVNYIGTVKAVKTALTMIRERNGKIINVSSIAGKTSAPFLGGYSASKQALEGFTDALRMELKHTQVNVSLVEPGPIETGFNERGREHLTNFLQNSRFSEKYQKKLEKEYTGASPEKPADTILKAVESSRPKARYVTPLKYRFLLGLLDLLPTLIQDRLISRR